MTAAVNLPCRQSGAALLLMMLVVIVGAAAVLVTKLNNNSLRLSSSRDTQQALSMARAALLSHAMSYPDKVPGDSAQLPCPDLDASGTTLDGEAHTLNCGAAGVSMLGRLPWRTLGIAAPNDSASECLWYVVSGEYKSAGAATSPMINPDSNGQLILLQSESGAVIAGQSPEERPVAMIIAPGQALPGQLRQALSQPGQQCSDDYSAAAFLDTDAATGISNAALPVGVGIDIFVHAAGEVAAFNDRVVTISRDDMADLVYRRHDFESRVRGLTEAIAQCIAHYGSTNPGGPGDKRLPWPAPVTLSDYRVDSQYDDAPGGILSGRLGDIAADSNAATGNSTNRVLSDCDSMAVPAWSTEMRARWQNWKDHFFYYVADSFSPGAAVPSNCVNCITVNGSGQYAAAVIFSNQRLDNAGQVRNAPPIDADTRDVVQNYLESSNSAGHPYIFGTVDLESRPADANFNDIVYCIDSAMSVTAC